MHDAARASSRREFLSRTAVGVAASTAIRQIHGFEPAKVDSAKLVAGKRSGLIVHTAQPLQMETPVAMLRGSIRTPADALFIRNNLELEGSRTMTPLPLKNWILEVGGMVDQPLQVDASKLFAAMRQGALSRVAVDMVLQCSGNGRHFFSKVANAKGEQWQRGAMGVAGFAGVRLADAFDHLGVKIPREARFVAVEGRDSPRHPGEIDFEHSLPLADALERSILAFEMNDLPLPAVHGGPLRLVTPGYYGTMQVKWVNRLRLEAHESANHHHLARYRTPIRPIEPGSPFVNTFDNSEPNWRMKTKCVILNPGEAESVAAGVVRVDGVAFGDGIRMETILVSGDRGARWQQAKLVRPASRYAWTTWSIDLALQRGVGEIWARAIDEAGRAQPLDPGYGWNPSGYAYYSVDRVTVTAR